MVVCVRFVITFVTLNYTQSRLECYYHTVVLQTILQQNYTYRIQKREAGLTTPGAGGLLREAISTRLGLSVSLNHVCVAG